MNFSFRGTPEARGKRQEGGEGVAEEERGVANCLEDTAGWRQVPHLLPCVQDEQTAERPLASPHRQERLRVRGLWEVLFQQKFVGFSQVQQTRSSQCTEVSVWRMCREISFPIIVDPAQKTITQKKGVPAAGEGAGVDVGGSHICPLCGKSFRRMAYLNLHVRSHGEEKTFKCRECDRSFSAKWEQQEHHRLYHHEASKGLPEGFKKGKHWKFSPPCDSWVKHAFLISSRVERCSSDRCIFTKNMF